MLGIQLLGRKKVPEEGREVRECWLRTLILSFDTDVSLAVALLVKYVSFSGWPHMMGISSCDFQVWSPIVDPVITEREALKFKVRMSNGLKFLPLSSI